ncbi:MAG: hypothetical protein DKM50_10780 [Candidatus Margulisiibacteriota bacterium]|nr:MAG: hypothetical protein A2X43_07590 [Candidatus Margulisbacteria bacterium GWD2_39_127]OGI03915.1 MAG: hypothetical protein A2X42_10145 [Candidatus Margulisbacteria bacterium GWF2_38_17]OGI08185.1 MAG: hypothetical protein A2X41_00560 [Candidatus Margulisbacteria bacterium GWE2_39_32]PZM78613.1 MAG: hypothetical protein DKM50_10780 [Candidatus Margulisiibacteriota bacterium]HAR61952.1 hypothetical protein [Candidatus Margulisiibacteriota bacterium]
MFIDEVGASEQVKNIDKIRKSKDIQINGIKSSKSDKLDISKSSEFQMTIKEALAQTPDIREDKVREVSQKIENNTYRTSSSAIAKKIMESDEYNGIRSELFS